MNLFQSLFQKKEAPAPAVNHDGVQNVLTGLGELNRDSSRYTTFRQDALLTQAMCDSAYSSSGIARRVVDLVVHDAMGKRIECDIALYDELMRLDAFQKITELATLSRIYGGAVMVLLAADGLDDLALPLNENRLAKVEKLSVFDRWEVSISSKDYDPDPMSDTYGELMFYTIKPRRGEPLKVHHSRVIRMDGDYLPPSLHQLNNHWGASALQGAYQSFLGYLSMQGFLQTIVKEFSLTTVQIAGLANAYASGNEKLIAKRLNELQLSRSACNLQMLDAESESFDRQFSSVGGYHDLITKGMELLSADTGIPMTLLFGRSPEGMNATGESDLDNWYKNVERYQRIDLEPVFNRLIGLLEKQGDWNEKPESFDWEWPTLQPLSELELADVRLKTAQADRLYALDMQSIDPDYLFHARHDGGFSVNLNYTEEALEEYMQGREAQALDLPEDEEVEE